MAGQLFDSYSFFDGLEMEPVTQVNWSNYWRGVIPDGVVAEIGEEMRPYANSTGMYVYVSTGACIVDNHRGVNSALKMMAVNTADATYDRIDLLVARVVYGNENESYMELDILTGTPAIDPVAPELTQSTGDVYEIALAEIYVAAEAVTLEASTVADLRNVFTAASQSISFINDDEVDLTKGMLVWLSRDNEGAVKRCPAEKVPIGVVTSDSIPVGSRGQVATVSGRIAEISCTEAAVKLGDALVPSADAEGISEAGSGYAGGLALEPKEAGAVGNVKALLTVLSGSLPMQNGWYLVSGISESDVLAAYQFVGRNSEEAALKNVNDGTAYILEKSSSTITWSADKGFYFPATANIGFSNADLSALYASLLSAVFGYSGGYTGSSNWSGSGTSLADSKSLGLAARIQNSNTGSSYDYINNPIIARVPGNSNGFSYAGAKHENGVIGGSWSSPLKLYYNGASMSLTVVGSSQNGFRSGNKFHGVFGTQVGQTGSHQTNYVTALAFYSVLLSDEQHLELYKNIKSLGGGIQ